jgi:ribosomal protein L30
MAKLRITYSKSSIGYSKDQKATVRSLGLGKLNSVVVRDDTPATRGMIFKVRHLVNVEEVADGTPAKISRRAAKPIVTQPLADGAPATTAKRGSRTAATQKLAEEPAAPVSAKASAVRRAATQKLPEQPTVRAAKPTVTQELVEEPVAQAEEPAAPVATDDLEVIEGVGPKIAGVLREAGIRSFADLAATSTERLAEILQEANLRLASPETWPEQAALAAAGDLDGLKQLKERLKGGRRE